MEEVGMGLILIVSLYLFVGAIMWGFWRGSRVDNGYEIEDE